jgi:hypothetical protein
MKIYGSAKNSFFPRLRRCLVVTTVGRSVLVRQSARGCPCFLNGLNGISLVTWQNFVIGLIVASIWKVLLPGSVKAIFPMVA